MENSRVDPYIHFKIKFDQPGDYYLSLLVNKNLTHFIKVEDLHLRVNPEGVTPPPPTAMPTPTVPPEICEAAVRREGGLTAELCRNECVGLPDCDRFKTYESKKICESVQNVPGTAADENDQCKRCLEKGSHAYTAFGCIPTTVDGFFRTVVYELGLWLAGGIAFLLMLWGSFTILISQGDVQQIQRGREIIISAIAGLLLIIFSMVIMQFLGYNVFHIPGFGPSEGQAAEEEIGSAGAPVPTSTPIPANLCPFRDPSCNGNCDCEQVPGLAGCYQCDSSSIIPTGDPAYNQTFVTSTPVPPTPTTPPTPTPQRPPSSNSAGASIFLPKDMYQPGEEAVATVEFSDLTAHDYNLMVIVKELSDPIIVSCQEILNLRTRQDVRIRMPERVGNQSSTVDVIASFNSCDDLPDRTNTNVFRQNYSFQATKQVLHPAPTDPLALTPSVPTSTPVPTILVATPTPTPAPPSASGFECGASPTADEVYLYDDTDLSGHCLRLVSEKYSDFRNISNSDVSYIDLWSWLTKKCANSQFENCISSVKLGVNMQIELYPHTNFQGTPERYTGDYIVANEEQAQPGEIYKLNRTDVVSSAIVCEKSPNPGVYSCPKF
ncbi:hypothetical protein HY469_00045 [Candidatus Roizmanbacteria bacterium]|nr:hypothetical protein [Candidatus Roizmanbacteria bacterium]